MSMYSLYRQTSKGEEAKTSLISSDDPGELIVLVTTSLVFNPSRLGVLCNSLSNRFDRLGKVMDVTKSILMGEKSVSLSPIDHPNNLDCLTNLGSALFRRFETRGG
jgi:hypothetical protein